MSKLADLLKTVDWFDVLLELEKEELVLNKKMSMDYFFLFLKLHKLKPVEVSMKIIIENIDVPECVYDGVTDYTDEKMTVVYGKNGMLNKDFECFQYFRDADTLTLANKAAEFNLRLTPWENWLGMDIEKNVLAKRRAANIVAICLWEMAIESFDESAIQNERERTEKMYAEFQAMSPVQKIEECAKWHIPFYWETEIYSWKW